MDILKFIIDQTASLVEQAFAWLGDFFNTTAASMQNDPSFRDGFIAAMILGVMLVVAGLLVKLFLVVMDRIGKFLQPTSEPIPPTTKRGPSPIHTGFSAFVMLAVLAFAFIVLFTVAMSG